MTCIGLLLLTVLMNIYLCHASLSPNGAHVQTKYQAYYVQIQTSKYIYTNTRTCTQTCGAHFIWCWGKKTVCRNKRKGRWTYPYKSVTRYRPYYVCASGYKKSGSRCIADCYGSCNNGYCSRPGTCSCRSGWTGSRCQSDINECGVSWRNRCGYKPGCINTHGSFRCSCHSGYLLDTDRRTCNDIDECSRNTHMCSYKKGCQNTQGSYRCTCAAGYYLDDDQRTCKDVDECSSYKNGCSYKAGCQNTKGSYKCTCLAGYYLDADNRTCKDVNECEESDCQHGCVNYPGGYNCSCNDGYRTTAINDKYCDDIDECSEKSAGCSQICTNTPGGFHCSCNMGYYISWNRKLCHDIDECKGSEHGCQHMCVNTLGSYKCRCKPGFQLSRDGKNCPGIPCMPIYPPVNGMKTCSGYTTEHTCVFSCSVGYKRVGSHSRKCSASRRWTGKETKCEPIHCPSPPEPTNGFIYHPCNTQFNSECLAGCDNGYYMRSQGRLLRDKKAKLTCSVIGNWEPSQITCNEIKVCEPNPCKHGGECTTITSSQFSCDCSNTGYRGTTCEVGVIDIPDIPTLVADVPAKTVFRASPPDKYVIFTPRGMGVEFNPSYLVFQRNVTKSQSLIMTAKQPGLHYVNYYMSGPSAPEFQIPETNAFFVESAENTDRDNPAYKSGKLPFPSGCYKLELNKCPRSDETIAAYSTSPWLMFGPTATTDGQVSLRTANVELPHSMAGNNFNLEKRFSLNHDCAIDSSVAYSTADMVKRRVLTTSFLKVVRKSLPKWLDIKLRGNSSSSSFMVETDLQAYYLSGKNLQEQAAIKGQPLSEDTFYSLLLSPDIDLIVRGDRVSFGLHDRSARFSVALEICGPPPRNVILRPSPGTTDIINRLSVMKQLRDDGWRFNIDSLQFSSDSLEKSASKRRLSMFATFSKDLDISTAVKSRVDFGGTIIINVENLNNIMRLPLNQKWLVELYGDIKLTLEFKVQNKMTKLAVNMARTQSYATFGGGSRPKDCSREMNNNPHGLHLTSALEENPFVGTELNEFVEFDKTRSMSCFLSTIFYTDKRSYSSNYREKSDGVNMSFRGHLKFGTLRFDNLDVKLWIENPRCPIRRQSGVVVEFSGNYRKDDTTVENLGIFKVHPDTKINFHIGRDSRADSGGWFAGLVNVLGFQSTVKVNISHSGLEFHAKGKVHGLFDASATFKSTLTIWKNQRYTATGRFDIKATADNLYRVLENELARYSTELLTKIETRLKLSTQTEERAKSRLKQVQILRDEWLKKVKKITEEYNKVQHRLVLAQRSLEILSGSVEDFSDEIRLLNEELNELCKVKECPKICQKGTSCTICWEYINAKKMATCPSTCHHTQQKRIPPLKMDAICKNEYCKRNHAVHSVLGDILGLAIGIGGTLLGVPPSVSFSIGKGVSQFVRSIEKGDPDLGALLIVPGVQFGKSTARKHITNDLKDGVTLLQKAITPLAKKVVKTLGVVSGVLSLVDTSQGRWECTFKDEKCTKERFEYKYIHSPYTCELPCEKKYVSNSIQKSCCSIVSCASFVADIRCISENRLCKKARKDALEQISKVKGNAAKILRSLDSGEQNVSFWKMKHERLSIKLRSASSSLKAYQDAAGSLEKAYNVTVKNQKRKLEILTKPLMLRDLLGEDSQSLVKIKDMEFKVEVSAEYNTTLLPINITMTLNGTHHEEISSVLDFTNLNRSLRSIAKEILGVYVGDVSRVSRKKRSTKNTNVLIDESKFYTLQTFHRLCSEFSNHKKTLYDIALSIYKLFSEIQRFDENETQKQTSLNVNNGAIFEKVNINQTKATEFDIDVNYDSYSNVLDDDPELLQAKRLQMEIHNNQVEALQSSSKLLYKNWLATMESIFETISEECSGFDDCLKYTIDSLSEIKFRTDTLNEERLRAGIESIEVKFFNLTRESDMSANDAVQISRDILQILENMTGAEDICAQAPNITEHPVPFTELGVSKMLVLRCNATGDSLVYKWRFNGEVLKHQSATILRINKTTLRHSGNYSCDVSNHVAKATSIVAVVVVGTPPLIVRHPVRRSNVILSEYDSLLCQVKKEVRNISYQWWFKSFKSSSFRALPHETFSRLSFAPVKLYHAGWYFCNVSNQFGNTRSRKSYVKVLKYSLPVPAAKLSLTVISKCRSNNISVFYQDTLAKVLASRFSTIDKSSQPSEERIKGLHQTGCRIVTQQNNKFVRIEICDWTFDAVGENVTSNAILNSGPSQQIKEIINATVKLKRLLGQLGNETNAAGITFSLEKNNYAVQRNSLGLMSMNLFCPKRQFLVENVYKCADCPPGSHGAMEDGVATCKMCPRNFYQSNPGQTSCVECPNGFITAGQGASHRKQCKAFKHAKFTNLGAAGRLGPASLGSHYVGKNHEKMVTVQNGIQFWTVPYTGTYEITAVGAAGGYDKYGSSARGRGAYMRGEFSLNKGDVIKILVGQEGVKNRKLQSSGGGGGSFVATSSNSPLLVAGGGGGIERLITRLANCDANTGTSGRRNQCKRSCAIWVGGINGRGALRADKGDSGGGGGGFYSNGRSGTQFGGAKGKGGEGGRGFIQGGAGGRAVYNNAVGGFGGGGGAYGWGGGAGGGGGYSGGASGEDNRDSCAGGGGSYNIGKNQLNKQGFWANGHGYVEIRSLA